MDEDTFFNPRVYDQEMAWDDQQFTMFDGVLGDDPTFTTDAMIATLGSPAAPSPARVASRKQTTIEGSTLLEPSESTSFQPRSATSSSSPESSSQDSSSESSGKRKRKSSSLLSPIIDGKPADSQMDTRWNSANDSLFTGHSPLMSTETDIDSMGRDIANNMTLFSAQNSPGQCGLMGGDHTITPAKIEKSFPASHEFAQPPPKRSQFLIGVDSRDPSPTIAMSNGTSPSDIGAGMPSFTSPPSNPTWNNDLSSFVGVSPSSTHNSVASPPSTFPERSRKLIQFYAKPMQTKSRVETQITVRLIAGSLPSQVTKLHLPRESISKTKNYAKEVVKSPDTLELHTSVVCASALLKPGVKETVFRRAARAARNPVKQESDSRRSSATNIPDDDPNDPSKPLNGGEVQICDNCVARERKRAARKRIKKQEDEETWNKFERDRIVVFNEKEYKDWQPPSPSRDGSQEFADLADTAMVIEVPMRIACYCRHQGEKQGFRVIFTLTDSEDNLVGQSITAPILITDDHKTHQAPQAIQQHGTDVHPGFYQRPYHSTNDLQGMSNSFQPQFFSGAHPVGPNSHMPSGTTSATMTPRNVSRQASPTAQMGANKRRKGSGSHHHRLPSGLTMTPRIDTQAMSMPGFVTSGPSSATTTAFTPSTTYMGQDPGFMNAMSMGPAMDMGPTTPGLPGTITPGNRNHSGDNLQHFFSVPNSARQSRSGSPVSGNRNSMSQFQQQQQHMNFVNGMNTTLSNIQASADISQSTRQPFTLSKILPTEGPMAGGIEVTCLGNGFTRNLEVMFGDTPATTTTWWSESTLVCLLPPAAMAGPVPVKVIARNLHHPSPGNNSRIVFTYKDDTSNQLFQLAIEVMSQRQGGDVESFKSFLLNMANQNGSSMGPSYMGGPTQGGYHQMQNSFTSKKITEDLLLRCLDVLDLDESPEPPQYNLQSSTGATMVSLGCILGYTRFVAALLARGADPETRDRGGFTPMMMASLYNHPQIVRRLTLRGVDPMMRSLKGYLAIDLARSKEVQSALQRLPHHARTRSAGAAGSRSRANSLTSLNSVWETATPSLASLISSQADTFDDTSDADDSSILEERPPNDPTWINSRRNSAAMERARINQPVADQNGFIASNAAAAAFGQIAAQFHQLQQNVHWFPHFQFPALPPMPNLENYQANQMVRRISSLVPHGNQQARDESSQDGKTIPTNTLSVPNWRDLFSSSPQPPPAYEEIYPEKMKDSGVDLKEESEMRAQAENLLDRKCTAVFDVQTASASSSSAATVKPTTIDPASLNLEVKIGRKALSKEEQQRVRSMHQQKRKPIYKDWHLWFIWIPLFLLFVFRKHVFDSAASLFESATTSQRPQGQIIGEL